MTTFLGVSPSDVREWDTKPSATDPGVAQLSARAAERHRLGSDAEHRNGKSSIFRRCADWPALLLRLRQRFARSDEFNDANDEVDGGCICCARAAATARWSSRRSSNSFTPLIGILILILAAVIAIALNVAIFCRSRAFQRAVAAGLRTTSA
jgi:hypothetical protein